MLVRQLFSKHVAYQVLNLHEKYYELLHEHETNKTQYYNRENDKTLDTWSLEHMYMSTLFRHSEHIYVVYLQSFLIWFCDA